MRKDIISLWIPFLFFSMGIGYTQNNSNDPRNEGQYMDYTTQNMPESPSASVFNAVGEIDVNPAKGIPSINIPLYTYELDGVQVPISLSYDASGIKVSQMSTAVGLGWSLVAGGQISRTVRSKPDEEDYYGWFENGYIRADYYVGKDANSKTWQEEMKGKSSNGYKGLVNRRDHNPDLFSYSLLGYNGTYIYDTNDNIIKEKEDGLTISSFYGVDNLDVRDLEGNYYYFDYGDTERSSNENTFHTTSDLSQQHYEWENSNGQPIVTAWKLSNITSKNGKIIEFAYESVDMEYIVANESLQLTIGKICDYQQEEGTLVNVTSISATNVNHRFSTQLLTEISSPHSNIKVTFEYENDNGLPDSVWKRKLKKITILDVITGNKREFHFEYSRFSGDPRLKLERVQEKAFKNGVAKAKPPHVFNYESGTLPPKDSKAQDLYGYYNLATNNESLVSNFFSPIHDSSFQGFFDQKSGNRALNINGLKRGVLTDITYPTGGKTIFKYEPNVDNLLTLKGYRGGLRVKEIENVDENNVRASRRTYQYSDLKGIDLKAQIYQWFSKLEGNTRTYSSSPVRIPGDWAGYKTGFFYGKVTMVSHGATTGENFKVEYKYKDNPYNIQGYEHVLESETIFRGTTASRLKVVEYEYDIISSSGTPHVVEWNVVGDMDCYTSGNRKHIGYTTTPRTVKFSGNYAYLPVRIATTEFPSGNASKRLTVLKDITYDPLTMLKKTEITDFRYKREENSSGTVSYTMSDPNAEVITMIYTYPFDVPDFASLPSFPQGTVIKQEVTTAKNGQTAQTGGRAYAFDSQGNIETVYSFEMGQGSNYSSLSYVPSHYQERTRFLFSDGHPVQVRPKDGIPTSYIWNLTANVPVAKIEGLSRAALNQNLVAQLEQADFAQLPSLLMQLRTTLPNPDKVFLTTYTYKPLAGVETITDPKGYKTTYEYDAFGRLQYVRDPDGNLLNETEYNYALD